MAEDFKGYYQLLGVPRAATAAEIKAAYRSRAMELHPDRNIGRDTTPEFQALQEAYAVLSNDKSREQYDADCAVSGVSDRQETQSEPIPAVYCDGCGCITGQPRFKVYYYVVGVIYYAYKKPVQGIFCAKCDLKLAVKTTLCTATVGWWGIWSFFWTLHALYTHLFGRKFTIQNAFLQSQQTFYFIENKQLDLACGSARAAIELIEKATGRWASPTVEQKDGLRQMQEIFAKFLEESDQGGKKAKFKSVDGFKTPVFMAQLLIVLVLFSGVFGFIYSENSKANEREIRRLVSTGFTRVEAQDFVENGATALSKLERDLPRSGIYESTIPTSGYNTAPFKINNGPSSNVLLKLIPVDGESGLISVFVRAGETVEVPIPFGSYSVRTASGGHWYGEAIRFGPDTHYSRYKEAFEFRQEGNRAVGIEVTLSRSRSGNLQEQSLGADGF